MIKYRVRGKLNVDLYVTVEAETEEEAMNKGFGEMDDMVTDELDLPGIHIEYPEILIQEAVEIKSK